MYNNFGSITDTFISENSKEKSSVMHLLQMQKLPDTPGQRGQKLKDGP